MSIPPSPEATDRPLPRRRGRPPSRACRPRPEPAPELTATDRAALARWLADRVAEMGTALAAETRRLSRNPANPRAQIRAVYYRRALGLARRLTRDLEAGRLPTEDDT